MKVLVIDYDVSNSKALERDLAENGDSVYLAPNAATAERLARHGDYSAVILDPDLPDEDGLTLIARLKSRGLSSPVLILSARRSIEDRVRGLEIAGGDYLLKPYALPELLARLRNLVRPWGKPPRESTMLCVRDLELNLRSREVSRAGKLLKMTTQEFALLELLCRHPGRVVTRSMIMEQAWGKRIQSVTNVIDVHIYRLRRKVELPNLPPMIRTVRGIGYVLRDH